MSEHGLLSSRWTSLRSAGSGCAFLSATDIDNHCDSHESATVKMSSGSVGTSQSAYALLQSVSAAMLLRNPSLRFANSPSSHSCSVVMTWVKSETALSSRMACTKAASHPVQISIKDIQAHLVLIESVQFSHASGLNLLQHAQLDENPGVELSYVSVF